MSKFCETVSRNPGVPTPTQRANQESLSAGRGRGAAPDSPGPGSYLDGERHLHEGVDLFVLALGLCSGAGLRTSTGRQEQSLLPRHPRVFCARRKPEAKLCVLPVVNRVIATEEWLPQDEDVRPQRCRQVHRHKLWGTDRAAADGGQLCSWRRGSQSWRLSGATRAGAYAHPLALYTQRLWQRAHVVLWVERESEAVQHELQGRPWRVLAALVPAAAGIDRERSREVA